MFHRTAKVSHHLANQTFDFVEIKCLLFTHTEGGLKVYFKVGLKY